MPSELQQLARAVAILRSGGLVAFPTETVYGLGADAENASAVRSVFRVKGRPPNHPLIVHLSARDELSRWARDVPPAAFELAEAFWPGPLTLILRRSSRAIDAVTGGADTVGLRVPAHPMALALLRDFGGGIAAPSANRFGAVSPTQAAHVQADLGQDVDLILDGGECQVGLESTIVDLSQDAAAILRPGGVTPEQLEAVLGVPVPVAGASAVRAPGTLPSHYAPRARVIVVSADQLEQRAEAERAKGHNVGVINSLRDSAANSARVLYAELRALDAAGCDLICVTLPAEAGLGWAIADRLRKAAGPRD